MRFLLLSLAVALGVYGLLIVTLMIAGRRTVARELATLLPNLLALFHGLLRDPRVPRGSKVLLLLGIAWIASPIDLVPEFIPVLGPMDDAVVAALILRRVLKSAGEHVLADHWRGEPRTLERILRSFAVRRSRDPGS
ncbi:MAG TPA: DUF1232 domain-containing protein [Actinomycetota bacterium]|nr:DUF1232 domain-containing protein [Actinomycetota bacterium]